MVGACLLCLATGFMTGSRIEQRKQQAAGQTAEDINRNALREAEALKKERLLEARDESQRLREEIERERDEVRGQLQASEMRLLQREQSLDKKDEQLDRREQRLISQEQEQEKLRQQLSQSASILREALERNAQLTTEEARAELFSQVDRENRLFLARRVRQAEEAAKDEADRKARRIISMAIQKWASEQVVESTVSVVNLPSDEMKGRIIGREGRNIRMLESLTGIDLIIDDTPEAVILSGFDPIRREVARMALEKLVQDGRIHPARIEEMVERARKEMDERIVQEGERAALEAGVTGLHAELIKLLGRLRFRASYGQNVLFHSLEVSFLCAHMAAELGGTFNWPDAPVCFMIWARP